MRKFLACALIVGSLSGCSTVNHTTISDKAVQVADVLKQTADYLKPISDSVMAGVCAAGVSPEACAIYQVASMGAGIGSGLLGKAIDDYRDSPTTQNAAALQAAVEEMTKGIQVLDAGYKGKLPVPTEVAK